MPDIVAPTEEQVMQTMSGEGSAPAPEAQAQPEATQQTATEQTAQPAQQAPDVTELIAKALQEQLNPIKSELGQFRKLRSEWQKGQTAAPSVPQSWQTMTPEQQNAMLEIVEHAWKSKFGERWEQQNAFYDRAQASQQLYATHSTAQQYAGQDWQNIDPIMGTMFMELKQKADSGDAETQALVDEIRSNSPGAVRWLVDQARQRYSQTVKEQAASTAAQQADVRKKAATALGNTNTAPQSADAELKQLMGIKDRIERVAALKKYWQDKGEL